LQLRDDDDAVGIAGRHIVALIDLTQSDAAVERRNDPAICQVNFRGFHRGLVGFHRALILGNQSHLGIECLMRHSVLRRQSLVSRQIDLRALEHGFVPRQLPLGLRQCGFKRPRIDLCEQVAFLDVITFREIDFHHVAADLRADRHGSQRSHGAQRVDVDSDVALADYFGDDRHRRGIAAVIALLRSRALLGPPDDTGDHQQDEEGGQDEPSARPRLCGLRRTNRGRLEVLNWLVHEPAIKIEKCECGDLPLFVAGTASRVRWRLI
jgi:hypothetical protein